MWSSVVKSEPASKPQSGVPTGQDLFANCKSAQGITMAVVDANAVIEGGQNLHLLADKFVTVPEVLAEIRDPVSRHRLAFIPVSIDPLEPSPESVNRVIKFARQTGDLQTLSDVDVKLIALTHTLEAQIHGTNHLRDAPPPIHTVNVKRLPEKELPGWGSNVPNLEEWEALEHEREDMANSNSRILPLKDLNLNIISSSDDPVDGSTGTAKNSHSLHQDEDERSSQRTTNYPPQKREVKLEGKKMVAEGIDASHGEQDDNADDWRPAVSRSTHRRFLKRNAKREYYRSLAETEKNDVMSVNNNMILNNDAPDQQVNRNSDGQSNDMVEASEVTNEITSDNDLFSRMKQMNLEGSTMEVPQGVERPGDSLGEINAGKSKDDNNGKINSERDGDEEHSIALSNSEATSRTDESAESYADDFSSEHSWSLRSLSESSIACITGDFAMQNVLLQLGLRLLAPGGKQIRQLHRWILKCHACYSTTAEIGRIFCPKCGNGGTLRKVAITVGENGVTLAARKPRITLRGTKFSLPLPQGGRDAITKNPVLREDQLPKKFLNPRNKKKDIDFFGPADAVFTHHTDKKAPLQPPVRKALAVFSGKRNPNDNHYARSMH